ncbi:hypothetical protein [Aneurinibacillus aneurinilyticus]|uniref:hypothetical protein n=1 Tax=Aneurinibacillus aneurinilyticus TaxID=1391 RepID=UPI0003F8CB35|nr:hypothetical protein [Aneurinibacillus aneurinilyticus]MED0706845.1 hypothetical protein [Aneurinibacillus aneurinilyticus]MED0725920.1 hypothetical protein [Aneurinibacillus aneurinilyticus]MED0730369.1 hypothetical protein [Aneurinibacillus aneurinilyticus]MED0739198.1 hypothetical protein [Aneurinibacillus aneurinilyticus]
MSSQWLQCPLPDNFFKQLGKAHSSEIRRAIHKAWNLPGRKLYPALRNRVEQSGMLEVVTEQTQEWDGAFRYSDEWNRYPGYKSDKAQFEREVKKGKWRIQSGMLHVDMPTWLTLASLSFAQDSEKESPNHRFLKELFQLYIRRSYIHPFIQKEKKMMLYGHAVRCDVVAHTEDKVLIGETGGVQLWKVMALLYKGYTVAVLPHWTQQKVNPFIRKRLSYAFYLFSRRQSDS